MHSLYTLIITVTACAALCACGGGDVTPGDPQTEALNALSVKAGAAAPSASPAAAPKRQALAYSASQAEQLFTLAEASYAVYFPSKQATRSFSSWSYRYYPETQIYLAVIDSDIYVLGGAFGKEAMRIGAISEYVKSVATGKDRPLTATALAQCPDASGSTSPDFYKCMVGYLDGTQTFDTGKTCRLEITEAGVFTLSSDNKSVTVGPKYGFSIYSMQRSIDYLRAKVENSGNSAFQAEIALNTSTGFLFSTGGKIDAEATPTGSSTASISCRLTVPK